MQPKLHDEGESQAGSPSLVPVIKSKRWDACQEIYAEMDAQSRREILADDDLDPTARRVWTGYIGSLMEKFKFTRSKGSQVIKDLERMGCIEIKEVGKRTKPSEIVVIQPPTQEAFSSTRDTLYNESHQIAKFNAEQASKLELIERVRWVEVTLGVLLEQFELHRKEDHAEK